MIKETANIDIPLLSSMQNFASIRFALHSNPARFKPPLQCPILKLDTACFSKAHYIKICCQSSTANMRTGEKLMIEPVQYTSLISMRLRQISQANYAGQGYWSLRLARSSPTTIPD